jgi:hypothetical protein
MIKSILKALLALYNVCIFLVMNVVVYVNHLWRPRWWTRAAVPSESRDDKP